MQRIQRNSPFDTDRDVLDDVWKLEHSLDPLNSADAASDPDGDGPSALFEYVQEKGLSPKRASVRMANLSAGVWTNLVGASSVFVDGSVAYVASNEGDALTLFDASDPYIPQQLSTIRDNEGGFNHIDGLLGRFALNTGRSIKRTFSSERSVALSPSHVAKSLMNHRHFIQGSNRSPRWSGESFLWEFPLAFWMERHGYDASYIVTSAIGTRTAPSRVSILLD